MTSHELFTFCAHSEELGEENTRKMKKDYIRIVKKVYFNYKTNKPVNVTAQREINLYF